MATIMIVTLRFHYIPSTVFPLGACPLAVVIIRREAHVSHTVSYQCISLMEF